MNGYIFLLGIYFMGVSGEICENLSKVGCFQKVGSTMHMDTFIYNGRSQIDWKDYESSIRNILCECKKRATQQGYSLIGLQYYGECWGSKLTIEKFMPEVTHSNACINGKYKACSSQDHELCSGGAHSTAVFVEQIISHDNAPVNGGYGEWSSWTSCSASCGHGVEFRERECNNPEPKNNGKSCDGEREEERPCFVRGCPNTNLVSFNCRMEKGEEFTNLYTVVAFSQNTPFCGVIDGAVASNKHKYTISVYMNSPLDKTGTRMGIMYNAKNEQNFEFVYIFLSSQHFCYSSGKVENGQIDWRGSVTRQCNRVFHPKQWLHFETSVNNGKIKFKVDNARIASWDAHMEDTGKGGVVLKNVFNKDDKQEAIFKDLKVE